MKILTTMFLLAVSLSAKAFDVQGIEPGKTTAKRASAIAWNQQLKREGMLEACKDYPPGSAVYERECKQPQRECEPGKYLPQGYKACGGVGLTLAGAQVGSYWVVDSKGIIQYFSANFEVLYYPDIKSAALAKWGKPTKQTQGEVSNRMNARFDDETVVWEGEKSTATLHKRSGKVDVSRLVIETKTYQKAVANSANTRPKDF